MHSLILSTVLLLASPAAAPAAADTLSAPAPEAMGMDPGWKQYDYANPPSKKDQIPSSTWVIIAYLIIWGLLLGYVVLLARRQSRLREELTELSRRIDAAAPRERAP